MLKKSLKRLGFFTQDNEIRVYWWSGVGNRNFGDVLGPYLIEKISGKKVVLVSTRCFKKYYMTIGSIIRRASKNSIIWGSGIMDKQEIIKELHKIYAVRGPKTRERLLELGFQCPEVYGDPALLISKYYKAKTKKIYKLGMIPHFFDYRYVKKMVKDKDVLVINVLDPLEKVLDAINACEYTVSSSLHGIIVSHSYNIKSMWVEFSHKLAGDGVKFEDYFLSVNIKPYIPEDYSKNIPDKEEIIEKIQQFHNHEIQIDLDKLMDACPFKKDL